MSLSSQNMLVSFGVYILKKTIANKNCGVRKKIGRNLWLLFWQNEINASD